MADSQHTHTCPVCGDRAARSVDYRRDGRWPETYSYCVNGHAWTTKAERPILQRRSTGAVQVEDFIADDEIDDQLYAASKSLLHILMRADERR